jgi:hypothetical protein
MLGSPLLTKIEKNKVGELFLQKIIKIIIENRKRKPEK